MRFTEPQIQSVKCLDNAQQIVDWDDGVKSELRRFMKYREKVLYRPWLLDTVFAGMISTILNIFTGIKNILKHMDPWSLLSIIIGVFIITLYLGFQKRYYIELRCWLHTLDSASHNK